MLIFFADDSVQRNCSRPGIGQLVGVGGILLDCTDLRAASDRFERTLTKFGVPAGCEIKWSPPRGSWIRDSFRERRLECYDELLAIANECGARAIVVCNDTARSGDSLQDGFHRCLDYLFERLSMHLEARGEFGLLVADRPGGGKLQEDKFLAHFLNRVRDGTEYVSSSRILLNALTTPSELVRHLQLADLVTGITTALVAGHEKFAGPLFPRVKGMFIRNRPGGIAATGLKIAPDGVVPNSLVNLYHWILGERLLHKGGGAVAYPLPAKGFPFEKSGGSIEEKGG